jgi:hypothetical protein
MDNESKKISIVGTNNRYQIKRVSQDKELKSRIKSKDWNFDNEIINNQCKILEEIINNESLKQEHDIFKKEINSKIACYKQQDISKNILNELEFITFDKVIEKLNECKLCCFYCNEITQVLYKMVREKKQWSLDRINNDLGHNVCNVVISCLDCNLQRRRKSSDAFTFTKQLILTRHDY